MKISIFICLLCAILLELEVSGCNPKHKLLQLLCDKTQSCVTWTCDTSLRDHGFEGKALCWHNDWKSRDVECGRRNLFEHPWRFSVAAPLIPGGRCYCCSCPPDGNSKCADFPGKKQEQTAYYGEELFNQIGKNARTDSNCWFNEEDKRDNWCENKLVLGYKPFQLKLPVNDYGTVFCCG